MSDEFPKVEQLTDWENPPKVADLKADFQAAKSDMDEHISKVDCRLDMLNITGSAKVAVAKGKSSVQPKLIRKQNEWRIPTLTEPFMSGDDLFNVDPVTYEDKASAIQNALVLNNQINTKIGKVKFIDEYIRTGVDEGTVIVRTGWDFREEEVEQPKYKYVTTIDPTEVQRLQQLIALAQQDPNKFKIDVPPYLQIAVQLSVEQGQPVIPVEDGTELVMVTTRNQPTWDICDYRNVSIDPTCKGDLTKAEFINYSVETSLSELEKDGRYSNLDAVETDNVLSDEQYNEEDPDSFKFKDKPRQKLILHEYWGYWDIDGSGKTTAILAAYIGNIMVRLEENPFVDKKLPFTSVQTLPVRKSNFGETDGDLIGDNQKIVGAVTRGTIDVLARSANGQVAHAKGALDLTQKRRFENGDDYEFNPTMHPDAISHMHKYPELPQSAGIMLQSQISDAESMTGVRPFGQSQTGSIGSETATGVKSAVDATAKRDTSILRRFAEGVVELGRKTISMNQQFLSEEEVIRVTNEEFVTVRKDDLAGNFDLRISISTAEEDNARAQELSFMLQTMGNNMDAEMSKLILVEIARLRKMPLLAKQLKDFQPKPDPVAQLKQQLEVAELKAKIAKLHSEAQENNASAQLDLAKARTEGSTADLKDLDFVEQENNTKHNRDVDKVAAQAEANTKMKIVESALNDNKESSVN